MKVAVIGCGSIGQRHIRNLIELGVAVVGVDTDPARRDDAEALGATVRADLPRSFAVDAVFVCTPAVDHARRVREAVAAGYDVFVEKPLATSVANAEGVLRDVRASDRVVAVGYNLRFEGALAALGTALREGRIGRLLYTRLEFAQYLPDWRPGRDYRRTVSAHAASGGGILLEASHELDVLRWLCGEWVAVTALTKRLSDLEVDVEDTVAAIIELSDGGLAELHLDFVRRGYTRRVICVGSTGTLEWDLLSGAHQTGPDGRSAPLASAPPANEMYVAEVEDFLRCVRERRAPRAGVEDGLEALVLVDAIRTSSERRAMVRR